MPPGFFFPDEEVRLWRPLALDRDRTLAEGRESHWLRAVGRLAAGAGPERLDAELRRLAGTWRGGHPHHLGHFLVSRPFREEVVGDQRAALGLLFAAVGLMLLIICANVGNLLLARAEGRQREMAVRAALGAGRGRLARQLLTESLLITVSGGVLGLLVAAGLMKLLSAGAVGPFPRAGGLALDARATAFAAVLMVLAGALFGLLPQLQGADRRIALQTGGRGTTAHRRAARVRRMLVVAEIALSLAVVSAAALMARSHERLRRVDLGIERSGALALDLALPETSYRDRARIDGFYAPLRAEVRALPGIVGAGLISDLPLRSSPGFDGFRIEGRPEPRPGEPSFDGGFVMATPGYFATLGIPVLRGRGIAESDVAGAPFVAVVDELAARRYWPDADPVGRRIRYYDEDAPWLTIVGVVGTVRYGSPREEPRPTIYVPHAQAPRPGFYTGRAMTLVVRAQASPASLVAPIRAAASRLDPSVPLTNVATVDEVVDLTTATLRTTTGLVAAFAVVSLLLGALGVYGILSYVVRTRTQEIGIRMALGEGTGAVRRGVLRQGLTLAVAGVAIGGAAALIFGRLLTGLLFGISPHDPVTVGAATLVLVGVSLIASYLPARRATLIPPAIALRGG
jgi:predicted permease